MKIRTTELEHSFIKKIYKELNAYCAQGLTLDENRDFSAVIQAIEYDTKEKANIISDLGEESILANYILANELKIPFYIIAYKNGIYYLHEVVEENIDSHIGKVKLKPLDKFITDKMFVDWWAQIKKTNQPHQMINGAQPRANQTIFDSVLQRYGLEWGGNVDGFRIENNQITCVFDDISIGFTDLDNSNADPALFFHKKGPVYNTWFSTVKLANTLNVPHILFTKNKNNEYDDRVGLSVIKKLTHAGIFYSGDVKPCNHIIKGIENIKSEINLLVDCAKKPDYE